MRQTLKVPMLMVAMIAMAMGMRAQGAFDYGNAWYQPGQSYLKLLVAEDGIYRVTQTQLLAAGVNLSGLNPNNLHVIYRGREIPIHVDATGGFSHLEFYGRRNDGRVDSMMYKSASTHIADPAGQPNIHISLFSDTSAYFVTWDGSPGLRYVPFTDNNYSAYTPEPGFPYEVIQDYPTYFADHLYSATGESEPANPFYKLNCNFVGGEGYTSQLVATPAYTPSVTLSTPRHSGLGNVELTVRLITPENKAHSFDVTLNSSLVANESYAGITQETFEYVITTGLTASTTVKVKCNTPGDEGRIPWTALRYLRGTNLDNATRMKVSRWLKSTTAYLAFSNAASTTSAVMYDVTAGYRIPARVISGTTLQFLVPGAAQERDLLLVTDGGFLTPVIQPTTSLANLSDPSSGADLIIITHRSLQASAEAYKLYRDTCTVNPMTCRIAYVDEIYDEFGYGTVTPWAIKRYCKYAISEYTNPPSSFLLWGKGLSLTRGATVNLVPTFGVPPTDLEFVCDFDYSRIDLTPLAAIGRVCVQDNTSGFDYLAKVNEYEHTPFSPWMKDGIQLGGGNSNGEQQNIMTSLQQESAPFFEGPPVGGNMLQWQRTGSTMASNTTLSISDAISRGSGLIHFFGHSADNVFDIDIRDAEEYSNYGKYPFMIAMGCYGGDFTVLPTSFGERFMLAPGRGSIGYFANTTAGLIISLREYSRHIYRNFYRDEADKPVGYAIQQAAIDFLFQSGTHTHSITTLNQVKQMALQCDPSIYLPIPKLPDPAITVADISFPSGEPNVDQDTFRLQVILHNLGRALEDSLNVRLTHRSPGGIVTVRDTLVSSVWNTDTLFWSIPNTLGEALAGLNDLEVRLDAHDSLVEYDEDNNVALLQQLIYSDAPAILLPYDYAIVPSDTVTLVAAQQALSIRADLLYLFEIDTTLFFNSPARRSSPAIPGNSARGAWKLPFTLDEDVVYYWRVRFADVNPASWATGSFRYMPGQNGWSQSRPHQMLKNGMAGVQMTALEPLWTFTRVSKGLHAFVKSGWPEYYLGSFKSDFPAGRDGLNYTPISYKTLEPRIQDAAQGDWTWASMPDAQTQIVSAIAATPHGDYFLMASDKSPRFASWSPALLNALEDVGVPNGTFAGLADNNPVVLVGRKGYPGSATVVLESNLKGSDSLPQYDIDMNLYSTTQSGAISAVAGPAVAYSSFDWQWSSTDLTPTETATVDIYGIRADNSTQLLFSGLQEGVHDLSSVDASMYPSIQLIANVADGEHLTPPQLTDWTVMYTPVPELTLDPSTHFVFESDSIQKGDDVTFSIALRSLMPVDMDSLLVRYWIETGEKAQITLGTTRTAPLVGLQMDTLNFTFNTLNFSGSNIFHVEVNPAGDQPEQHHFNNLFEHPFYIYPDDNPPIMDVTVDGKHLMEGDIVSPQPEITVMVKDDNIFMPLTVSDSTFEILFGRGRLEEGLSSIPIEGNPRVEAIQATLPENRSRLVFRPGPLEDGEYTLRISTSDQSGNETPGKAYEIHFNVVNESSITRVLPYPNPFSSSCRWAYLLTGSEVPYRFEIEIYTISGRLVRRIDLAEQETIRVGYNLTETIWDGRDEYGDELANGVYIYKVLVKFKDRETEIRNPGSDIYFSNDFGKIYLMR